MGLICMHEKDTLTPKIVQICHGPVIPDYVSAYSLRCHSLFRDLDHKIISVGGAILRDDKQGVAYQFRSILLTGYSVLKGNRAFEILLSTGRFLRGKYKVTVRKAIQNSDVVVFEGPWQYRYFKNLVQDKIVVYDAHNCETNLRDGNKYYDYVRDLESELVNDCDLLLSVTSHDNENLKRFVDDDTSKFHLVPHVLPDGQFEWNGQESREICFIGSMYGPNVSALEFIIELSKELQEFTFNIIGNVASSPRKIKSKNVKFLGVVSENKKNEILSKSMVAINPVNEGSGRNVKMVDFLLHAVPIISTEIGTRGFEDYDIKTAAIIAHREEFAKKMRYLDANRDLLAKLSENSRNVYEEILRKETLQSPSNILLNFMETN